MALKQQRPIHDAPVWMPSIASTAYSPGDLLWSDTGVASPASSQADQVGQPQNQVEFAVNFVGICGSQKLVTDTTTGNVQVIQDSEYKFGCAATTFLVGDLIGAVEASGGASLENQLVAKVTDPSAAIGVVTEAGTLVTGVWARPLGRFYRSFYGPGDLATGPQMIAQTIDMANAAVKLTKDAAATAGVYMSGNLLIVDPNGAVTLTMPLEQDCPNSLVIIKNIGAVGENLTVVNDAAGGLQVIDVGEFAILHSDGTTWTSMAAAYT